MAKEPVRPELECNNTSKEQKKKKKRNRTSSSCLDAKVLKNGP